MRPAQLIVNNVVVLQFVQFARISLQPMPTEFVLNNANCLALNVLTICLPIVLFALLTLLLPMELVSLTFLAILTKTAQDAAQVSTTFWLLLLLEVQSVLLVPTLKTVSSATLLTAIHAPFAAMDFTPTVREAVWHAIRTVLPAGVTESVLDALQDGLLRRDRRRVDAELANTPVLHAKETLVIVPLASLDSLVSDGSAETTQELNSKSLLLLLLPRSLQLLTTLPVICWKCCRDSM